MEKTLDSANFGYGRLKGIAKETCGVEVVVAAMVSSIGYTINIILTFYFQPCPGIPGLSSARPSTAYFPVFTTIYLQQMSF